jgi:hypothetical protein
VFRRSGMSISVPLCYEAASNGAPIYGFSWNGFRHCQRSLSVGICPLLMMVEGALWPRSSTPGPEGAYPLHCQQANEQSVGRVLGYVFGYRPAVPCALRTAEHHHAHCQPNCG